MLRIFLITVSLLSVPCLWCAGQVTNDDIANRIPLVINSPHTSSTVDCSVEWMCLNQKLTQSCIKYHNDQWFSFAVNEDKQYYINLGGQVCKDIWGVQVLVFDGVACNPASYQLLACHSDGNTDDIFIRLPKLEIAREYLVNVDGYLHDLCTFTIELSDVPKGLPLSVSGDSKSAIAVKDNLVKLTWTIDENRAGSMLYFEIFRSAGNGKPFKKINQVIHQRNAFGEGKKEYDMVDTLEQSYAEYKVVAQDAEDRVLLLYEQVSIDKQYFREAPENNIDLTLDYRDGDELGILIYDLESDTVLVTDEFRFQGAIHSRRNYYIGDYKDTGIRKYKVVVIQKEGWIRREFIFVKN